ncbi:MAG: hypothetical protein ABL934_14685 [Lysobacteraceae bacterium]
MTQNKFLRDSTIAAFKAIVASGCVFPRHSRPSTNKLESEPFCPGGAYAAKFGA